MGRNVSNRQLEYIFLLIYFCKRKTFTRHVAVHFNMQRSEEHRPSVCMGRVYVCVLDEMRQTTCTDFDTKENQSVLFKWK